MLLTCASCEGFLPRAASACPHCGAAAPAPAGKSGLNALGASLGTLAASGAVAMTLMACYGGPPCDVGPCGPPVTCDSGVDQDGDGFCSDSDCNDLDASIFPGNSDAPGDGIDSNCDGADGTPSDVDAGSDAAACLSCAQALGTPGTTPDKVCAGVAAMAFEALQTCACQTSCSATCGDTFCDVTAASSLCQSCIDDACSTQKLDCQEN